MKKNNIFLRLLLIMLIIVGGLTLSIAEESVRIEKYEKDLKITNRDEVESKQYGVGKSFKLQGQNYSKEKEIRTVMETDYEPKTVTVSLANDYHWRTKNHWAVYDLRLHGGPAERCGDETDHLEGDYPCRQVIDPIMIQNDANLRNYMEQMAAYAEDNFYNQRGGEMGGYTVYDVITTAVKQTAKTKLEAEIGKTININDIEFKHNEPVYVYCENQTQYIVLTANASYSEPEPKPKPVEKPFPIWGTLSFEYVGFTGTAPNVELHETTGTWVTKNIVIKEINLDELEYDDEIGFYGKVIVTSTLTDGSSQSKEVKIPFGGEYKKTQSESEDGKHILANLYVDGMAFNSEALYLPGSIIQLNGERCILEETFELFGKVGKRINIYRGVTVTFDGFEVKTGNGATTNEIKIFATSPDGIKQEINTLEWYDEDYDDDEYRNWETEELTIVNLSGTSYDETGVHRGSITVTGLTEHGTVCTIVFPIKFGPQPSTYEKVDVTIKINPSDKAGTVKVNYLKWISETEAKQVEEVVRDGQTIPAVKGSQILIKSLANDEYVYRDVTSVDGNVLKGSERDPKNPQYKEFTYGPIHVDTTLIINFEKDPSEDSQDAYTLYVTSTEGGSAWVDDDRKEVYDHGIQSKIEVVHPVVGGEKFTLYYKVEEGYQFEKWEYRPRITSDSLEKVESTLYDGYAKITMPYSDLTATAVFKKVKVEEPNTPDPDTYTLKVTSNNELWGEAWAKVDGEWIKLTDNAIAGGEYEVYFKANPGYYFTNWDYDSLESPFIEVDKETGLGKIIMPANDLEIKAFFSPIPEPGDNPEPVTPDPTLPEPDPNPELDPDPDPDPDPNPDDIPEIHLHDIIFISEFKDRCDEDGGTVPENLVNVRGGAKITMAVTPYAGFEFVRWYFTDAKEHEDGNHNGEYVVAPDSEYDQYGSGSFIMPDYDVVAHAVFKKAEPARKLTILIVGEGDAYVNDINIPSGNSYNAKPGQKLDIDAETTPEWEFKYWVDEDGKILSEDPDFIFTMPNKDVTIIAYFGYKGDETEDDKGPYTLYVTSMYGGHAWTDGNENHPKVEKTQTELGQYVYKIENVYGGEKFEIYYEVNKEQYSFDEWEYRPYIKADSERGNKIVITMPNSDLTVTAVFKKDTVTLNPKLSVTSNNEKWGEAFVIENGNPVPAINYEAKAGEEYTLVYYAADDYYFTNWDYSTTDTPFIATNKIIMPNIDLEVMAFFAPIPGPDENKTPDPEQDPDGHEITFVAEPPWGGSVPDDTDLKEVKPGSKVTIAVTPNQGWEFDYWYFTTLDGTVYPTVEYDKDGTGYFIMPNYDIIAHAVFKKVEKGPYTLYVTYTDGGTAWTIDEGREVTRIDDAIPLNLYDIKYEEDAGYEFVEWQYRWNDKVGDGVIPGLYEKEGKVIMPHSHITVTAVFKKSELPTPVKPKLKITSNNYLWGTAWVMADVDGDGIEEHHEWKVTGLQQASTDPGIELIAGEEYKVYFKEETGYEFTDWNAFDGGMKYFKEYPDFKNGIRVGTIVMPSYDLELMAYFKPGDMPDPMYSLTLICEPEGVATLTGGVTNVEAGTICYPKVNSSSIKNGYEFKYWYRLDENGKEIYVSDRKTFEFELTEDTILYAKFIKTSTYTDDPGDPDDPEDPAPNLQHSITIIKDGDGDGYVKDGDGNRYVVGDDVRVTFEADGTIILTAVPDSDSTFDGWIVNGEYCGSSTQIRLNVTDDLVVRVIFSKKTDMENAIDDFKIISVRDLRWQDYFVDENGNLTNKTFGIPSTDTSMLQSVNNKSELVRTGYAVEFELDTITYSPATSVLVVKPSILVNGRTNPVDWKNVKDGLSGKTITELGKDFANLNINPQGNTDFTNVVIFSTPGKNKELNERYKNAYQTSSVYNESVVNSNTGVSLDKIKWRWVYYLPAKLEVPGNPTEITIKFDIEIHEVDSTQQKIAVDALMDPNAPTKRFSLTKYAEVYKDTDWDGKVYKYTLKPGESLLDDIYNNAT